MTYPEPGAIAARIAELEADLSGIQSSLGQIEQAISNLQRQAADDKELSEDAEFIDRLTIEGGRKRILERSRENLLAEIVRLGTPTRP